MNVAIIGGGPIGMAAAAKLVDKKIAFQIYEAGSSIGNNILDWGHVKMFSPWRYNIDKTAQKLLSETTWEKPNLDELPTGKDLVEKYLNPLAQLPNIRPYIYTNSKVINISRKGIDKVKTKGRENYPFELRVETNGKIFHTQADVILDATGTYNQPNPIGSSGLPAIGEEDILKSISYGIPDITGTDKNKFLGKSTLVVGSGHSAINTLIDLAKIQEESSETKLHWVIRNNNLEKLYGGQNKDGLEARGALGIKLQQLVESGKLNIHAPFLINRVKMVNQKLTIDGTKDSNKSRIYGIDHIINNTGSRPELKMLNELRIDLDSSLESVFDLAPLIDPNVHSCGTVRPHGEKELRHPEKNFYIVGSKSYGRAPTFLLATGYEQVRSIIAYLTGDLEGAKRVELDLPETGVCSTDSDNGEACCAPTQKAEASQCC